MVASAKREPGKLNIGTPPPGTSAYLGGELFKSIAGADITIVTYRGTGPLTTDLLGGHVKLGLNVLAPAMSMLKAGQLNAIAVLAQKRSSHLPDVPTSAEAGLPGFESGLNYGLLAPAGTPKAIVDHLNKEINAVLALDDMKALILRNGAVAQNRTPAEWGEYFLRKRTETTALAKRLGIEVQP